MPSAAGTIASAAAQAALDTGVDPRAVAAALYIAPTAPRSSARSAGILAERRRQLRAQIAALQRALGELEARYPALVPLPAQSLGPAGPRLLDVGELEHVQAQLISRLATLHGAIDKVAKGRPSAAGKSSGDTARGRATQPRTGKPKTRPAPAGA